MIYDLAIIGGGASGTFACLSYLRKNPNKKVIILESNDSLLKKLKATGNGKCNFANEFLDYSIYENGNRIKELFNKGKETILEYFDYLGIRYYKDLEGRYYPLSNSAKSVKILIEKKLEELGSKIELNFKVDSICKSGDIFKVSNGEKEFLSKSLIVSTGNKNYPKLGSDGSIFDTLKENGIKFTNIYPSCIYINVKEKKITKALSGERFSAGLTLVNDGKNIYQEIGEILFKDDALSGIVTFNVSSRLSPLYKNDSIKNPKLLIDFLPDTTIEELNSIVSDPKFSLYGLFSPKLSDILKSYERKNLAKIIKNFEFNISSLGDFTNAQVASGGIDLDEINKDFESKRINGLYFTGDILDIQAPCGGYNLSFAFLSGIKAGLSV